MTENNAAQPGLTDELSIAIHMLISDAKALAHVKAKGYDASDAERCFQVAQDRVCALLSKLRAEGVQAGDDWPARWEKMRHEANEWADMAINGLQWVRNIQDGTSTADAALANLNTNLAHCRATQALASAPVDPEIAEVDFLVRVLDNLDTWRAEDWSELLERRPAILAMLRPMVLASAPVAGEAHTGNHHTLKTDPEVFQAVLSGAKTFEIRLNDRGFQVGDALRLRETRFTGAEMREGKPLEYTGRECRRVVSHVLTGYGLADGWCCLSFAAPQASECECARKSKAVTDSEAEL